MSEHIVEKFGGTSMARPEEVASRIEEHPGDEQQLIVVSAPGKYPDRNITEKTTDLLYGYSENLNGGKRTEAIEYRDKIISIYNTVYDCLGESDRRIMEDDVAKMLEPSSERDVVYYAHIGEVLSAQYLSRLIGAVCLDSAIVFADNGRVDRIKTFKSVQQQMADITDNVIIPGFFGYDGFGRTHLLGRGGSDRTGALYAAALDCDYINWTDVDGISSADPEKVDNTQVIPELTREEVREGAHGGSGVLVGDALADLGGSGVPTIVKNTFNPSAPGTLVLRSRKVDSNSPPIVALSGRNDFCEISIRDMGMANEHGYVAKLLNKLNKLNLSLELMPAAQDSISMLIAVNKPKKETEKKSVQEQAIDEFVDFARGKCLSKESTVEDPTEKGVVYAVGERLRDPKIRSAAGIRLIGDIVCAGFDVEDVVSNRLSPSIAFLVQPDAVDPIIQAIHMREIAHSTKLTGS